jgi:hypothetical protein
VSLLRFKKRDTEQAGEELLDVNEVARVLRVKKSWCYNDRTLPWIKVGKYRKLFAKDLQDHLDKIRDESLQRLMRRSRIQEIVEKLEVMD